MLRRAHDHHRDLRARQRPPSTAIFGLFKRSPNAMTTHHHRASSLPRDLIVAGWAASCAGARQHEPHSSPRRNRPSGNHNAPACAASARLDPSSTASFPSASRITSTTTHQAQTLNPHSAGTEPPSRGFLPWRLSGAGPGARPTRGWPASETHHNLRSN